MGRGRCLLFLLALFGKSDLLLVGLCEDVRDIQPGISKLFRHLVQGWRLSSSSHKLDSSVELIGSGRLETLVHRGRILLETLLVLLQAIVVMLFRAKWNVFLAAEVLGPLHLDVSVHLIDTNECW